MTEAKFGCNHLVPTLIHIDGGQQGVIKVEHLVIGSPSRAPKALEDKAASLTLQIGQISPGIHRLIRVTIVEQISQCTIQPMFVNQGRGRHKTLTATSGPAVNTRETILIFILVKGIDVTDALSEYQCSRFRLNYRHPANSRLMN